MKFKSGFFLFLGWLFLFLYRSLVIFRPHTMGENHNLCCVFFLILPNLHSLHPLHLTILVTCQLLHLVNSSHHGAVGSVSAWQTRGRAFEHVLMRYIFVRTVLDIVIVLGSCRLLVNSFRFQSNLVQDIQSSGTAAFVFSLLH